VRLVLEGVILRCECVTKVLVMVVVIMVKKLILSSIIVIVRK